MPRSCNQKIHQENQQQSNCSECYKYSNTIPLVDHVDHVQTQLLLIDDTNPVP